MKSTLCLAVSLACSLFSIPVLAEAHERSWAVGVRGGFGAGAQFVSSTQSSDVATHASGQLELGAGLQWVIPAGQHRWSFGPELAFSFASVEAYPVYADLNAAFWFRAASSKGVSWLLGGGAGPSWNSYKSSPGVEQDSAAVLGAHGFLGYAVEKERPSGHAMRLETRLHLHDGHTHALRIVTGGEESQRENVSQLAISVTFGYRFYVQAPR